MQPPQPPANRAELTPVSFLERSALVYPDRVAVVHGDRRYTYRELGTRVNRLASALRRAGLQRGDRVVFISPNTPAMLEAHFGVPAAGGVLVALNHRLAAREIYPILEHSGARLVFVDREYEHLVEDAEHLVEDCGHIIRVIPIDDTGEPGDPYEAFIAGGSPQPVASVLADEQEPISINYTSGTTGKPKGAVYSHRGAYLNALGEVLEARMTPESVHLWTLPMFHCNGWCFPWAVTAVGARHVCMREVDPATFWGVIDEEAVTHYSAAPTVQAALLAHPDAHPVGREIVTAVAGSPPTGELFVRLTEVGFRPIHVYGATELYGPYTVSEPQDGWKDLPAGEQAALLGRQGVRYVTSGPVRVVDDQDRDVEADGVTLGEVLMRGNNVMLGYFRDGRQTEAMLANGWYRSGDLGVRHPDGRVELRDRKRDVIVPGGENIASTEVERAIWGHPAVAAAAAVPAPGEKWRKRPEAFVEREHGKWQGARA